MAVREGRQVKIKYQENVFYCKGVEALEQDSQRGCGCPNPESVPGQVEQDFE